MEKSKRALAYTESRTLRDEAVNTGNYDFLDKLKAVQYLTDDMILSVFQAADYYEVSHKTIHTIIARNRDEFEQDGMLVLKGEELKQFKASLWLSSNEDNPVGDNKKIEASPSLTILTKRSLLRIGLIMTNCALATRIRNYLLNLEETSSVEQKGWAIQREVGKIERRRMTTAIKTYLPDDANKPFAYPKYTNMLYMALFGKEARQLREERGVSTNDALRDSFTQKELSLVEEGETIITALVCLGLTYEQIRQQLARKYAPHTA